MQTAPALSGSRAVVAGLMVGLAGTLHADAAPAVGKASDLNPVTFRAKPEGEPVAIVIDGKPAGTIAVMTTEMPESGTPANRRPLAVLNALVEEMQTAIELSTGAKLEIQRNTLDNAVIVIGDCELTREHGLDVAALPTEGFMIKTIPGRVLIVGDNRAVGDPGGSPGHGAGLHAQGTAWGVAEFLERFVGVRWYWPVADGGRSVVRQPSLSVPPVWLQDAPVFNLRTIWQHHNVGPLERFLRHGGVSPVRGRSHVPLWNRIPGFTDEHPEVFQVRSDGSPDFGMLCYSHPKTLEKYIEQMAAVWDHGNQELNYDTRLHAPVYGDYVVVGPNDASITCKCEPCQALFDPAVGQYGRASRIIEDFESRLAAVMKARWPDKKIYSMRYVNYTLPSETLKARATPIFYDVCIMPGSAQLKEPGLRQTYVDAISRFHEVSGLPARTYEYACWPQDRTKAAFQWPHALREYYGELAGKIEGSFIDAYYQNEWPRQHVTLYSWAKLLWNPAFDVDAMMDEYARRMYGAAATDMRELLRLQTDGWEQSRWPAGSFNLLEMYEHSYPKERLVQMKACLQNAQDKARDDAVVTARIDYYASGLKPFFAEAERVHSGTGNRELLASKVGEMPIIDGKLDDEAWKLAEWSEPFQVNRSNSVENARFTARVKAVWSQLDGSVAFAFHCEEPDLKNRLRLYGDDKDNGASWWDDCIEMLIDPTQNGAGPYFHFILTAGGGTFDGSGTDNPFNPDLSYDAADAGMKWAQSEGDGYWTLEIHFPWGSLPNAWRPATGVQWQGNFLRHRMVRTDMSLTDPHEIHTKGSDSEYSRLNAAAGGGSANPANFGAIRFVE